MFEMLVFDRHTILHLSVSLGIWPSASLMNDLMADDEYPD